MLAGVFRVKTKTLQPTASWKPRFTFMGQRAFIVSSTPLAVLECYRSESKMGSALHTFKTCCETDALDLLPPSPSLSVSELPVSSFWPIL